MIISNKGIPTMKKIAFLMILGMTSALWSSEEMTVQVISAVHEKSITPAFDAKLKKSGLEIHKKVENGRHIVTLGTYPDHKKAQQPLKKARAVVAKDAFIRPVNRHPAEVAQTKTIQPVAHTEAVPNKAVAAAVESPKPVVTPAAVPEVKQPVSVIVTTPTECDKKEMRKDAFAEAIRYYKTSPYHRFEPVVLRQ